MIGRRLGAYEVIERLGQGGMGQVYLARHAKSRLVVALKVLPPWDADAAMEARFRREFDLLERLDHPGIVRPLAPPQEEQGLRFLVLEYVPGKSLDGLLREHGKFDAPTAAQVLGQVLEALACAHEHGIVHRDLKPANILVDPSVRVKVADFGIARPLSGGAITRSSVAIGTPAYMAPEQWEGGAIDPRTDLYAAGVIFFEMLAGRTPYRCDNPAEAMQHHLLGKPPECGHGEAFDRFIGRAMAKTMALRFPDARAMLAALDELVPGRAKRGEAAEGGTLAIARSLSRARRRRRAMWAGAGVLVAAAAVALAAWLWPGPEPAPPPAPAGPAPPPPPAPAARPQRIRITLRGGESFECWQLEGDRERLLVRRDDGSQRVIPMGVLVDYALVEPRDRVVLRDGRVLQGEIQPSSGPELVLRVGNEDQRIPLAQVLQIIPAGEE